MEQASPMEFHGADAHCLSCTALLVQSFEQESCRTNSLHFSDGGTSMSGLQVTSTDLRLVGETALGVTSWTEIVSLEGGCGWDDELDNS